MRQSVAVHKFGGSTFLPLSNILTVAQFIHDQLSSSHKIVVCISAPAGLTEQCRTYLSQSDTDFSEDHVELLTLSDYIGAVTLNYYLKQLGIRSTVVAGQELGIFTDNNCYGAKIEKMDPLGILSHLPDFDVIVVPGAQGSHANIVTWLGKNSSDYTAVLLASMLETKQCFIHSDVSHIYDKDPNIYPDATALNVVDYGTLMTASKFGAKVIHHKALAFAKLGDIQIVTRSNQPPFTMGTVIRNESRFSSSITVTDQKAHRVRTKSENDLITVSKFLDSRGVTAINSREITNLERCELLLPMSYINHSIEIQKQVNSQVDYFFETWEHEIKSNGFTQSHRLA